MRCLLVDDEPGIREGLAALLRKKGHDVHTAGDCASAGAALAHEFDVVVTDWRLPDGTAAAFWSAARCPVVAVSGQPEEVLRDGNVREVLTKPVTPARLLQVLAALGEPTSTACAPAGPVLAPAADTQRAIDAFVRRLPAGTPVVVHDDGTFLYVAATLAAGQRLEPAVTDGELSWTDRPDRQQGHQVGGQQGSEQGRQLRLRLRRDGHPATQSPVIAADAAWPDAEVAEFAVDFHGRTTSGPDFLRCLDRALAMRARGGRVQFLNVPPVLHEFASSHGRAHDMPMRDPVGPSLQAEFADLWRES